MLSTRATRAIRASTPTHGGRPVPIASWRALGARLAILLALGCLALLVGTHAGRTGVRTLLFLPEMFPNTPLRPITLVSTPPVCEAITLAYADTTAVGDLCYPPGDGRYGAIVLSLGVHPLERDDPFLVRLHDGLARTQLAVLRLQSPDLSAGRIVPREADLLVAAFQTLQAHPRVDATRIGLAGFSVGGALSTVAAADPRIRDDVRLVYSFGAYSDAFDVLRAITSGQIHPDGGNRAWTPHHWTVHVFAEQIIAALPDDEERAYLTAALAAADAARDGQPAVPPDPPGSLSPLGQMLYTLAVEGGRVDADALLAAIPPLAQATFIQVSPSAHVAGLRAPLYLMHDVGDTLIPYTEARELLASLPPGVPRDYGEFHMFEHVYPRAPHELIAFLPDLAQLYRHLNAVFLAVTE
jgi:hypothetical protein